jgi:S1-C subfamily serine protease
LNIPKEASDFPQIVLTCNIEHPAPNQFKNTVTLTFTNCNNELVYKSSGSGSMGVDLSGDYKIGVKKALKAFTELDYYFNSIYTPKLVLPSVDRKEETETTLKEYFSNNSINPIEGIYKSMTSESIGYYKIGIKKYPEKYAAVLIESDNKFWKQGEVKAYIENTSVPTIYSVKWFKGDKKSEETFATLDNDALLSIEFTDLQGKKKVEKFIKLFPSNIETASRVPSGVKVSGTGFFVSPDGIVATNSHVIKDAKAIEIQVYQGTNTKTFKCKTLLSDSRNDVALLKIDDANFKPLASLPYGVKEIADVGEDVFTIGYPLNSIMGETCKLTNGIISSKSGINDDVRFYQISVPIQPGNSGGPLFNKDGYIVGLTTAKLNGEAIGKAVENVNYAIKISYLINLYGMLPEVQNMPTTSKVVKQELTQQVKTLQDYVCLIKVTL